MIKGFKDGDTEGVWNRERVRRFQAIERQALRRLRILDAATSLEDLRNVPSNRLHQLSGDRDGQWAIWINTQYRVCFHWEDDAATEVEITDYHD